MKFMKIIGYGISILVVIFIGLILLSVYDEKNAAKKNFDQLEMRANSGNADEQYRLAEEYYEGDGVQKDHAKAFEWYQKAAAQGNASAQYELGQWYDSIYGGNQGAKAEDKDDAKAFEWYQKAAAQGNDGAQYELGEWYNSIYGGNRGAKAEDKDDAKAFEWYQKAAAQGNTYAQIRLNEMSRQVAQTSSPNVSKNNNEDPAGNEKRTDKLIEWREAASDDVATYYFDISSLRKDGDVASMWVMQDFNKPVDSPLGYVLSIKGSVEYDCTLRKFTNVRLVEYSKNMGSGRMVFANDIEKDWQDVDHRLPHERFWNIACGQ